MRSFQPRAWYWSGPLGVFSSAAKAIVPATDAPYQAWRAAGGAPTPWPRDDSGAQTAAALDAVLAPYGLTTGLADAAP